MRSTSRRILFVCSLAAGLLEAASGCGASDDVAPAPLAAPDAGGDAASPEADAGVTPDAAATGEPIDAPADQWTWVDFPESKCASGTPTGIGINPHADAEEVLIYFQGGGQCVSGETCWGKPPSATFLGGYDGATFAKFGPPDFPLLDRAETGNPLRAASMVFVPYCTGDLHAGTKEVDLKVGAQTKPTYFWGARDLQMFLARLVPTFPHAKRVVVAGASAGGYATFLSFDRVADAFGTRVDLLDDSGPPLLPKGADTNASLALWGYEPPAGCTACDDHLAILAHDRERQPSSRFGFLLFQRDTTISERYKMTLDEYATAIDTFTATLSGNAAAYVVTNFESHVVEKEPSFAPGYLPWVTQMLTDDAAWTNTTYAAP